MAIWHLDLHFIMILLIIHRLLLAQDGFLNHRNPAFPPQYTPYELDGQNVEFYDTIDLINSVTGQRTRYQNSQEIINHQVIYELADGKVRQFTTIMISSSMCLNKMVINTILLLLDCFRNKCMVANV